jgi:hypothetical protein
MAKKELEMNVFEIVVFTMSAVLLLAVVYRLLTVRVTQLMIDGTDKFLIRVGFSEYKIDATGLYRIEDCIVTDDYVKSSTDLDIFVRLIIFNIKTTGNTTRRYLRRHWQ